MNAEKRLEIFKRFQKHNPEPKTELEYRSDFELLVAVILSAQATDVGVNKATQKLYSIANTPEAVLELGEEQLKTYIRSINYFNNKAKNIFKMCQILVEEHASKVPSTREELEALPGVGRKTANVVLNTLHKLPAMAVDTHIFRVANRTKIAPGKDVLAVEMKLYKVVPKGYLLDAHHWLVLHGRYVCKARKPLCGGCLINDLCEYGNKQF